MKRKLLSLALALVMVLSLLPVGAMAAEDVPEEGAPVEETIAVEETAPTEGEMTGDATLAEVQEITSVMSTPNIIEETDSEPRKTVVKVTPANPISWSPEQQSGTNNTRSAGWWVGIKIIAPSTINDSNVSKAVYYKDGVSTQMKFDDNDDGKIDDGRYLMTAWSGIPSDINTYKWTVDGEEKTGTFLQRAADLPEQRTRDLGYTWYFNWDGDEKTGRTVTVNGVEMKGIDDMVTLHFKVNECKLKDKTGENIVWPEPAGTKDDPFIITANDAKSGIWFEKSGYYKLAENITTPYILADSDCLTGGMVTLDLAGYTITQSGTGYPLIFVNENLVDLSIVNSGNTEASLKSSTTDKAIIEISDESAKLTVGRNVKLDGTTVQNRDGFEIVITGDATGSVEVNLNGCTINGANGITVNGICKAVPKITLNGATIIATYNSKNTEPVAIYQAGPADSSDVNIADSTITASGTNGTGIEIRAGKLTLTNSTVTGGTGDLKVDPNSSGSTTKNAAVAVSQHTTCQDIAVKLSGNVELNGTTALSVANPQNNTTGKVIVDIPSGTYNGAIVKAENAANATLTITGGTFNEDVSEFVPQDTHKCTQSGGKWVVDKYISTHKVTFSLATGVVLTDVTNAEAVTGTPEVYTVTDGTKAVTFKLTAPENAAVKTVTVDGTALTPVDGVYTIPANLTEDVTVTVTTETTVQDAAKLEVNLPSDAEAAKIEEALGKKVSDLQTGLKLDVSGRKVAGTSNYVKEFAKFNPTDKTEQQGNYIALKLETDKEGVAIRVKSNNGDAEGYKTLDEDGLLVHRISVDTDKGTINPIHVKLGEAEYDINLTEITLGLPPMPAPEKADTATGTVTNDLSTGDTAKKVEEDIKNTIANVSTGSVDDKAEGTPDVTGKTVTITFSGKVDGADNGGSVKLDKTAVAALKNDHIEGDGVQTVTVSTKVETNVADVVLPAGALKELAADKGVEVSVQAQKADDVNKNLENEDHKTLISAAEVIADVTVKQDTAEPFKSTNLKGDSTITIRIKVLEKKPYQAIYIDPTAKTVTKVDKVQMPEGDAATGYYLVISVGHLSTYAAVDAAANKDALDKLDAADNPSTPKLTYTHQNKLTDADKTKYYGGKLELSNLEAGKNYVLTFDYGSAISGGTVPRAVVVVTADAQGKAAVSCQDSMKVTVQATGADNNVNASKLTAIFYDPAATNQGVLVTNSSYITQVQ